MAKRDYYNILGLTRGADEAEIKKAYRRAAQKFHPDRNSGDKGAEEKFKEAKEAYEVLSDTQKRGVYDQYGHAGVDAQNGASAAGAGFGAAGFADIFGEVFGDIFGGARGGARNRPSGGADLRYNLELSLEQAVRGDTVTIRVPTLVGCKTCHGSGAKPGTEPARCATCGGVGQVRMQQGFFSIQQTCPRCRGAGTIVSDPCTACRGRGRTQEQKTLSVKVPAGVDNGDRIRLAGEGEAGDRGGTAGDLYVQISVAEHLIFHRDGSDLACEVPISLGTAALGGELEVPTLDGQVLLKIPAETQTGKIFRLRGKGVIPVRGGPVGDLLCRVVVETPVHLNAKQRQLLREFEDSLEGKADEHNPQASSWLGGVKRFFDGMKF